VIGAYLSGGNFEEKLKNTTIKFTGNI